MLQKNSYNLTRLIGFLNLEPRYLRKLRQFLISTQNLQETPYVNENITLYREKNRERTSSSMIQWLFSAAFNADWNELIIN
jgi:hypothetical protein